LKRVSRGIGGAIDPHLLRRPTPAERVVKGTKNPLAGLWLASGLVAPNRDPSLNRYGTGSSVRAQCAIRTRPSEIFGPLLPRSWTERTFKWRTHARGTRRHAVILCDRFWYAALVTTAPTKPVAGAWHCTQVPRGVADHLSPGATAGRTLGWLLGYTTSLCLSLTALVPICSLPRTLP
jgi:hypothetical protein